MDFVKRRLENIRKGAKPVDSGTLLKNVLDDKGLISVKVALPSIIKVNGMHQSVKPGKILRFESFGRENVQEWIDTMGLAVVAQDRSGPIQLKAEPGLVTVPFEDTCAESTEIEAAESEPVEKPAFKMDFAENKSGATIAHRGAAKKGARKP